MRNDENSIAIEKYKRKASTNDWHYSELSARKFSVYLVFI
jgi:hypothetical protein